MIKPVKKLKINPFFPTRNQWKKLIDYLDQIGEESLIKEILNSENFDESVICRLESVIQGEIPHDIMDIGFTIVDNLERMPIINLNDNQYEINLLDQNTIIGYLKSITPRSAELKVNFITPGDFLNGTAIEKITDFKIKANRYTNTERWFGHYVGRLESDQIGIYQQVQYFKPGYSRYTIYQNEPQVYLERLNSDVDKAIRELNPNVLCLALFKAPPYSRSTPPKRTIQRLENLAA